MVHPFLMLWLGVTPWLAAGDGRDLTVERGSEVRLDASTLLPDAQIESCRWRQVTEPDVGDPLPSFKCPVDWADNYGTRVRGYVHPPATGDYVFFIASDDASELRLSTDADPAHATLIAHVDDYSAPRQWDRFPSQRSTPVRLEEGRRYYTEALQKEGEGGDHLSVAWARAGGAPEVIDGRFLSEWGSGADSPTGRISREVWLRVPGSSVRDLVTSPRFPGAKSVTLNDAESSVATFAGDQSGCYEFELAARVGGEERLARTSVLVTDVLRNGDFESGEGGTPTGWTVGRVPEGVTCRWEEGAGIGGSRCISIHSDRPVDIAWEQALQLAPYTPYLLTGFVRGEGLKAEGKYPAAVGAANLWKCENGPATDTASLDWTRFAVDFATDPNGQAAIVCRLGAFGDPSRGTVYFDDVTLVRNPDVETFEGEHFILHLYRDEIEAATREGVERQMRYIDRVCDAYTEFTGYSPGGDKQSAWSPRMFTIDALGWSGNPLMWTGDVKWMSEYWTREGYCAEVFLHELAHNWDPPSSMFHTHFSEFMMAYALEVLDLAIGEDGWTRGPDTRHRWEVRSRGNRELGEVDEVGQVYKSILIRDKIGWEPFKKVYRWFLSLPPDQVPQTAWDKFRAWHEKLSEFSGFDAWSVYTPDEIEYIRYYYAPHTPPEQLPTLGQVREDRKTVSLTDARWESATVGWEEPKYAIYGSAAKWHPQSIYAHAPSSYVYRLGGKWTTFRGWFGLARGCPGSVVFVVKVDGKEVLRTDLVTDNEKRPVSIDVTGADELELIVEDGGNGRNSDHGVWFSPELQR